MEQLNFKDVLKICDDFLENPSDEANQKILQGLKESLIIKTYLPLQEKVVALYKMILDNEKSMDLHSSIFTIGMEVSCLFNGLLAYTNIINITEDLKTYESYDTLHMSGVAEYIWEYCYADYEKLVRLLERAVNYTNLLELTESITQMDTKSVDKMLEEFKAMKASFDPQTVQNMADIIKFNDPTLYRIKEDIIDGAMDQLDRLDTLEQLEKNKKS